MNFNKTQYLVKSGYSKMLKFTKLELQNIENYKIKLKTTMFLFIIKYESSTIITFGYIS